MKQILFNTRKGKYKEKQINAQIHVFQILNRNSSHSVYFENIATKINVFYPFSPPKENQKKISETLTN